MKTLICIIVYMSIFFIRTNAQIGINDGCWRTIQSGNSSMLRMQFDSVIRVSIQKLTTNKSFTTDEVIMLVKIDNTLNINRNFSLSECLEEKNPLYIRFKQSITGRKLFDLLTLLVGTCIPNHGMGCHYSKYNLDWGGAGPNQNSLIKVLY